MPPLRLGLTPAAPDLWTVECQERQTGDDSWQGEREVNNRVDETFAPERVPHEHPRDERARNYVDGNYGQRSKKRKPESGNSLRVGDRLQKPPHTVAC